MAMVPVKDKEVAVFRAPNPKKRKRPKTILEEDAYVSALEKIIQRDFFPDLPMLKAQHEYLTALENDDMEQLHALAAKYNTPGTALARGAQPFETPSVRGTPAPFDTPATPRSEHGHSKKPRVDEFGNSTEAADASLSLDAFLAKYTSEDNASFEEIIEKTNEDLRRRYQWLYEKVTAQEQQLSIGAARDEKKKLMLEDGKHVAVEGWRYTPKNALMYYPEGVELTAKQEIELAQRNVNEVRHGNTRFARGMPYGTGSTTRTTGITPGTSSTVSEYPGAIQEDGSGSPKVNGYGFVSTPAPAPGVNMDPLLTWGSIAGTPVPAGRSYKMQKPSSRDELVRKMVDKNTKKKQVQRIGTGARTPHTPGTTVIDRLATMSPAARRLAARKGTGSRSSLNQALRKKYSTPGRLTSAIGTPKLRTPRAGASTSSTPRSVGSEAQSVTDGLL